MRDQLIEIETADDGDALPRLEGAESTAPIAVVSVVRAADQIVMTYRRPLPDIRFPRIARAIAAARPRSLFA